MCKKSVKKVLTFLMAAAAFACLSTESVFAKGKEKLPELPKEEEGFYYGYGKASTPEEAEFLAKKELIENALTEELKASKPRASRISISDDSVRARLQNLKIVKNDKTGTDVSCKIKHEKWSDEEELFRANLSGSLNESYQVLKSRKSLAEKIDSSVYILNQLSVNGVYDLLPFDETGIGLYSKKVEEMCGSFVDELVFTISVPDGFVSPETKYSVTVKDKNEKAVPGLSVKASWEVATLPVAYEDSAAVEEIVTVLKTDSNGVVDVTFPESESFKNKPVILTVSTAFSASKLATSAMRKLDARSSVDANYICFDDFAENYKTVLIEAGDFEAGAIEGDRKAGSKEAKHTVTLEAYEMSLTPVTNAQFAAYIFATRGDEYPEYMNNPDYNKELQPVIGISYKEALSYAAWLSEQTGDTYRLPTADEWEKAARAGEQNIYPWGNDDPSKKKIANYNKNGKYKGPSPVGAFAESTNAWGLVDMSGNVWEWTSSEVAAPEATEEKPAEKKETVVAEENADSGNEEAETTEEDDGLAPRIVKGGSWMDGPAELRISNFKTIETTEKSDEVGFRLVKEVKE